MSDFVLVHGAWHGAWCWRRVLPTLWGAGHRVFTISLSGVGERAHLLSPDIRLQTHIDDVASVIEAEELEQAVLVGHSYAGMVITGVADRMPARIGQLVYLDAVVPEPGESWSSRHSAATQAERRALIERHGCLPALPPTAFGLQAEDARWVERRQTAHPGGVYDDPLHFDPARLAALPRSFIDCTDPALPTIAVARQRVREQPGWQVMEIATGHDAMISAPEALCDALLSLAKQ
ncbi:alpha/beta fold hydrolase [Paucibacter sp. APW11]|uniref:Alpha/beta fold hydrolase n=1 Tax=Roseateles aquae TaxID=3077235 RepID=A0ABU3PB95_9BURK|nr:alpha/beta fold hydrolase [Paucibacter sp. APW11]MDT8999797.1 alpha/beta fold hydrolase [Paucibacter sp. APW11]